MQCLNAQFVLFLLMMKGIIWGKLKTYRFISGTDRQMSIEWREKTSRINFTSSLQLKKI